MPFGISYIGYYAFFGCSNLTSITIPDSVINIDPSAFEECSSLPSVAIPNSVTNLGVFLFLGCSNLTSVYFMGNIPPGSTVSERRKALTSYPIHPFIPALVAPGTRCSLLSTLAASIPGLPGRDTEQDAAIYSMRPTPLVRVDAGGIGDQPNQSFTTHGAHFGANHSPVCERI